MMTELPFMIQGKGRYASNSFVIQSFSDHVEDYILHSKKPIKPVIDLETQRPIEHLDEIILHLLASTYKAYTIIEV